MTPAGPLARALRRAAALAGAALLGVYLAGSANPKTPQVFPAVG